MRAAPALATPSASPHEVCLEIALNDTVPRGSSVRHAGQTVVTDLVEATRTVTKQNKDGTWSFIIPRFFNGGTIIGGTKEPGDWATQPDLATREQLIRRGRDLLSSSSPSRILHDHNIGVIADVVGRRPTRDGGMRIEIEKGEVTLPGKHQPSEASVVHAYGAGGRGYEISWGVADEVVQLAAQLLAQDLVIRSRL
jgi:D-amino-acid oxidase